MTYPYKLTKDDIETVTSFIRRGKDKAAIEYLRIRFGCGLMIAGDIVKDQRKILTMIPSGC